MIIGKYVIRLASTIRNKLLGSMYEPNSKLWWRVAQIYGCRLFGLCIYRHEGHFLKEVDKILEEASGEARTDSNNEQAKEVCPNCYSNDVTELIKNDFYCYACNYSWTN